MTYKSTVQADAPVHWWRLQEGRGSLAHDIGSNPFVLVASTDTLLGYSAATTDGGSAFFPTGQAFSTRGNLQSLASPISMECWFWPTGVPGANAFLVAWDGITAGDAVLFWTPALKFSFLCNGVTVSGAVVRNVQQWHHVVGTWDNATVRLYVDGAADGSAPLVGPHTFSFPLGIGANTSGAGSSAQGCIGDAAVYGSALSAAQVLAHYNAADQRTVQPANIQAVGPGGGDTIVSGNNPADLTQILNSVRKSYVAP